jgi:hypothetical protein
MFYVVIVIANLFFTHNNSIPEKQDIPAQAKNHGKRGEACHCHGVYL